MTYDKTSWKNTILYVCRSKLSDNIYIYNNYLFVRKEINIGGVCRYPQTPLFQRYGYEYLHSYFGKFSLARKVV